MARKDIETITDNLQQAIALMKAQGADYAEANMSMHQEVAVTVNKGMVENLVASKPVGLSLHMRVGDKSEGLSLSSNNKNDLKDAVAQLAGAIQRMPDNIYDRPVEQALLSKRRDQRGLDLVDRGRVPLARMIEDAKLMEQVAMAVKGVQASKGASASWTRALYVGLDSRGERFIHEATSNARAVSVIARSADDQRTGGEGHRAIYYSDLKAPEVLGQVAGIEAVQALNPGQIVPGRVPVVFHPDVGASLLGHFSSAIQGAAVRKKTSFLTEAMNQAVFAPWIHIKDNPHLKRGLASRFYSSSGIATQPMDVVADGILRTWFMGMEDARRLGLEQAPHVRGPSNLTLEPGDLSPQDLISDIKDGLFVTGLMGQGIDLTSGQYSRAANGFVIKDGMVDYSRPVSNVSVSGNLKDMFMNMHVANDLDRHRSAVAVPTIRVEGLSIA